MKRWILLLVGGAALGCSGGSGAPAGELGSGASVESFGTAALGLPHVVPVQTANQTGPGAVNRSTQPVPVHAPFPSSTGMDYHGGPVLSSGVKIHYIWYGDWANSPAPTILSDWASGVGASQYYGINATYYDLNGHFVNDQVSLGEQIIDRYSLGRSLSQAQVGVVVSNAITSGKLPLDQEAVYYVLTSKDVAETGGFCTSYCGWHWAELVGGAHVRFAFVGDPARCPSSCEPQHASPNGDPAADAMASVMSRELNSAVSDPDGDGWYAYGGTDSGDKCAWSFGLESKLGDGARYNMSFGGRYWLIQENWVNEKGGRCALSR